MSGVRVMIGSTARSNKCNECGERNIPNGANYCPYCGEEIVMWWDKENDCQRGESSHD